MEDLGQAVNEIPETLRLPFTIWNKCGFLSKNKFKKYIPMTGFALSLAILVILGLVQYINIEKDVSDFVRNLEEIFAFTQVLGKVLIVTFYINDFLRLIEITKLFWNPNKCSQQTATKLSQLCSFICRLQKALMMSLLTAGVLSMVNSLIEKSLPTGIWTLEGYDRLYSFMIAEQLVLIPFSNVFISSIDCMYLGFCTEMVVQFKILCQYLEELEAEGENLLEMEVNYLSKMRTCIQHHQLMLWFIKKFRKTFSLILLIQYLTIGPLICAELFAAFESRSYRVVGRHAFIFVAVTLQLSFYCISANYLADEALTVSKTVYFSKWYSHYFPSLKIPLLLMMQNAQKEIIIKAGGLVTINTGAFMNILKVAWSASSLARGLRQN